MTYTYIGVTPRFLESGRPVTTGTVLEDADLALTDETTRALCVPSGPAPEEAPAPAPAEAPADPEPAHDVVTTGNPS